MYDKHCAGTPSSVVFEAQDVGPSPPITLEAQACHLERVVWEMGHIELWLRGVIVFITTGKYVSAFALIRYWGLLSTSTVHVASR